MAKNTFKLKPDIEAVAIYAKIREKEVMARERPSLLGGKEFGGF